MRQELVQLVDDRLDAFGIDLVERDEGEDLIEEKVSAAVKI